MTILNRPMFMNRGGQMRHDERTIRNVDDELYRIAPRTHSRGRERINAREEYARDLKEKDYLRAQMNRLANGGQPMPMPMGAAPMLPAPGPGPEAQVQMTEAAASQEGEALGQEYLGEMMTGIDTADSTEELIDAIRGNDKTLQDRYDELANFVGERDASATPESVLTLVQPTIMMTEQGAMDSGIGELMQGIAGEVEMETEMGAPTPMGQGVGELMMTESVEEVIPQMNAGGPVQYFANGMEVSNNILDQFRSLSAPSTADQFSEMVESRMPVYQRMLGDTDQTKKDIQSKLYFDMAQAGLNLASGVDPRTGQSMTGRSLGSQIASAAQPVAASAGQAAGEMRNVDRAAAAGALQSAEAAEAARIGSARLLERDLLGGAIAVEGREDTQAFTSEERAFDRQFQRQEGESDRDLTERLATQKDTLERDLFDKDTARRIDEILQRTDSEVRLINERGDVETGLIDDRLLASLKRDGKLNEYELGLIEARMRAESELIGIRGLEQRATLRLDISGRAGLQDDEQLHQLEIQGNTLAQREREFGAELDRLLGNDEFSQNLAMENLQLNQDQLQELINAREAYRGGERGWIAALTFDNFGVGETAFDLQQRGVQLQESESGFMQRLRSANAKLSEELSRAESDRLNVDLGIQGYQATTDRINAIQGLQTDYSKIFGSSQQGIMRGILSDTAALERFGSGRSSPAEAQQIISSIEVLSRPTMSIDPSGFKTYTNPTLPAAVVNAARSYTQNVGPMFNQGGPVVKMANGGDPQMTEFERRITKQPRSALEPTLPSEGRIVDETINFETTTGLPSGVQRGLNVVSDTFRDVTGVGPGPIFPDVERGGEQLKAIANMTQRFIRDSVAGRPFAVEIEALAEEIAQPGGFRMDERNLVKLQTMRSQLLEIGDIATSVLEAPEGFDRKSLIEARQDLTQLAPLVDNYNKIITSYKIGLGKEDKPDPAMFELGPRR